MKQGNNFTGRRQGAGYVGYASYEGYAGYMKISDRCLLRYYDRSY